MIPKIEDCKPGLKPMGYNVLVALDVIEERIGSIIIPDQHKDRENSKSEKGRVVSLSPMAFSGGDFAGVSAESHPQVSDVVLFQRYAGTEFEGDDGKKYRIIADTDLKGVYHG